MSRALEKAPEMTNARADYYARIGKHSMTPLWEVISKLLTREPQTKATPHIWKYDADRKSTRLNSSHIQKSRMPSSA